MNLIKHVLLVALFSLTLQAEYISIDVDTNTSKAKIILPYIFSTESTGLTLGAVGIFNGYGQKNMTVVASAFVGERITVKDHNGNNEKSNTRGLFLAIANYQTPFMKRLFVSFLGSYAYYPNQQIYLDGANNSSKSNVFATQGFNNWFEIPLHYSLALGENKNKIITEYRLKNGIPINRDGYGGGAPFVTGRTAIELTPFYNNWTADKLTNEPQWNTNGLKLALLHDNTDYTVNPTNGYKFNLEYSQDFGEGKSTQSWNALESEYSQYIKLDNFSWSRQSVLAFNIWTAYSPSWDKNKKIEGTEINAHRPPPWEGAHLGGWTRMRGYDTNRFSDKAAIYYGAEFRVIPKRNPLKKRSWVPVNIDWFQLVAFAELGRVAPKYNLKELHEDMKYDVGLSLRALAAHLPVRFDMAVGEEGLSMWVMVREPF